MLPILVVALLMISCQNSDKDKEAQTSSSHKDAQISSSEKPDNSGKVLLTEYSDYQCPACASYYPVVERLKEEFGDTLQLDLNFFPLTSHQYGALTARAAQAAKNQGKFHEMHSLLFKNQKRWVKSDNPVTIFVNYARDLNLDMKQFQHDLNSSETQKTVMGSKQKGLDKGVHSTPTFFINGTMLEQNPRTYNQFEKLIEDHIDKKEQG